MRARIATVLVLIAAALAVFPTPAAHAAAHTDAMASWKIKSMPIASADVAFVPSRNVLLVTAAAPDASVGNELVEMNPTTGQILRHVPVGSQPGAIAVSDDGSVAFIALGGASSITKVDLATFTVTANIAIPQFEFSSLVAEDLAVQPGTTDVVVVAGKMLKPSAFTKRLVMAFDNGTLLPNKVSYSANTDRLVFTSATTFLGLGDWRYYTGGPSGSQQFALAADGVTIPTWNGSGTLVEGEMAGDLLATKSGDLMNPSTGAVVQTYGNVGGPLEASVAEDRIVYVTPDLSTIYQFKLSTGESLGSRPLSGSASAYEVAATTTDYAVASSEALILVGTGIDTATPVVLPQRCIGRAVTITASSTTINGTAGDDVILGTPGNDTIDGKGGNDIICGGNGNDTIIGGDGSDYMLGGNGNDIIEGGAGVDFLFGDPGYDRLRGGAGNDRFDDNDGGAEVDGGDGTDIYSAGTSTMRHKISLDNVANDGIWWPNGSESLDNIHSNVEIVVGSPGDDYVSGDQAGYVWFIGAAGNDTLTGTSGPDKLDGGPGNDTIDGKSGDDFIIGGAGTDSCVGGSGTNSLFTCES